MNWDLPPPPLTPFPYPNGCPYGNETDRAPQHALRTFWARVVLARGHCDTFGSIIQNPTNHPRSTADPRAQLVAGVGLWVCTWERQGGSEPQSRIRQRRIHSSPNKATFVPKKKAEIPNVFPLFPLKTSLFPPKNPSVHNPQRNIRWGFSRGMYMGWVAVHPWGKGDGAIRGAE